jgi:hypothetical protein
VFISKRRILNSSWYDGYANLIACKKGNVSPVFLRAWASMDRHTTDIWIFKMPYATAPRPVSWLWDRQPRPSSTPVPISSRCFQDWYCTMRPRVLFPQDARPSLVPRWMGRGGEYPEQQPRRVLTLACRQDAAIRLRHTTLVPCSPVSKHINAPRNTDRARRYWSGPRRTVLGPSASCCTGEREHSPSRPVEHQLH